MAMSNIDFEGFDWDEGNETKSLQKHGVTQDAIEALFASDSFIMDDPRHSAQEHRLLAVGITKEGRWVVVAFTFRTVAGKKSIRPISARYMHDKEVKRYEKIYQEPK